MPDDSGTRSTWRSVERVAVALLTVLAVLDTADELASWRRRLGRDASNWWAGVERRQRASVRRSEAAMLSNLLNRSGARAITRSE